MAKQQIPDAPTLSESEKEMENKLQKINYSAYTDYPNLTPEKVNVWKNTVFKDAAFLELIYFASVAHAVKLNPDTKEIWAWKDKQGKIVVTVAEVGYRVNAERHPDYMGVDFGVVYDGDEFEMDFINKKIVHNGKGIPKGKPIGAWAVAYRKGLPPIYSRVSMDEYSKAAESQYNAWNKNPSDMIAKVARTKALSVQFPISGAIPDIEVVERDGQPDYRDHHEEETTQEQLAEEQFNNKLAEALEIWDAYEGADKQRIGETIRLFQRQGTLTIEMIDDFINEMQR